MTIGHILIFDTTPKCRYRNYAVYWSMRPTEFRRHRTDKLELTGCKVFQLQKATNVIKFTSEMNIDVFQRELTDLHQPTGMFQLSITLIRYHKTPCNRKRKQKKTNYIVCVYQPVNEYLSLYIKLNSTWLYQRHIQRLYLFTHIQVYYDKHFCI